LSSRELGWISSQPHFGAPSKRHEHFLALLCRRGKLPGDSKTNKAFYLRVKQKGAEGIRTLNLWIDGPIQGFVSVYRQWLRRAKFELLLQIVV